MKRAVCLILGVVLGMTLAACAQEVPRQERIAATTAQTEPAHETTLPEETTVETEATEETTIPTTFPELPDEALVAVRDYIPNILVELKYAGADNFTGQVIYGFQEAYLRYGTVKKLQAAQEAFGEVGMRLKIWDAFRPAAAQFKLWEVCPDDTYVADPRKGYSNHTRGNAVDVTLVDAEGNEIEMPTEFDDFSGRADRNYSECPEHIAENAMLLQTVMENHGFKGYYGEWWHFADTVRYEVEETFNPADE